MKPQTPQEKAWKWANDNKIVRYYQHDKNYISSQTIRKMLDVAVREAEQKKTKEIDKELNKTMHEFGKLMAKLKIPVGVDTKLLVPFMRFVIKLRKHLNSEGKHG